MQITNREYRLLLDQKDLNRFTIHKKRRCFLWNNQYFQLDFYQEPCPPAYIATQQIRSYALDCLKFLRAALVSGA